MQKTGIEWADYSWNPVSGCRHACEYCYARRMAVWYKRSFEPAFHEEKLRELTAKTSGIVFCGSNCDLWGNWVPDDWIHRVLTRIKTCENATVMMLTKNPEKYGDIIKKAEARDGVVYRSMNRGGAPLYTVDEIIKPFSPLSNNIWLGTTLDAGYTSNAPTGPDRLKAIAELDYPRKWISVEPYLPEHVGWYQAWLDNLSMPQHWKGVQWVVFGVRTNPTTKLRPADAALLLQTIHMLQNQGKKVFVKNSIVSQSITPASWPREFPEGVRLATKPAAWQPGVKKG